MPSVESQPDPLPPASVARAWASTGAEKVAMDRVSQAVLGGLAGAFIGLGAMLFTVATTEPDLGFGPARLLGGLAFSLGLILVVAAGAELFTGNTLTIIAWASRATTSRAFVRSLALVYGANFVGAVLTALLIYGSGHAALADHGVGARALVIASEKVSHGWGEAFALGVLCNALVTLAVWLALGARGLAGKTVAIVFPITAFVAAGFEHSIANMYFIPMGLLLKGDALPAAASGLSAESLDALSWGAFLTRNLAPVTLGNIVGGALLVGMVYWFVYLRPGASSAACGD